MMVMSLGFGRQVLGGSELLLLQDTLQRMYAVQTLMCAFERCMCAPYDTNLADTSQTLLLLAM